MAFVLGVDSGGTKTLAAVARQDGTVIRLARSGSLDPMSVPDWQGRLQALTEGLGPLRDALAAAVFGLPYHSEIPDVTDSQDRCAAALLTCPTKVDNDVRIAFDGAFAGGAGGLILAGTGSMAWASLGGPDDPHTRAGGWGEVFGDEGSAYWIGRQALAAISQELDGRRAASGFSAGMLAAMGIGPEGLLDWVYGQDHRRSAIAGLARPVAALAQAGDRAALGILHQAGDALAETLSAAWRKAAGPHPLRWSFAGGVTGNAVVLDRIAARVGCAPQPCLLPPVGGALLRAARLAGWPVTGDWLEQVARGLSQPPTGD